MMTVQFVEIAGQRIALLPEAEFRKLAEAEDIQAAVRAEQRRLAGEEYVSHELVSRIIDGEAALRVWREYRGFSPEALAEKAGVSATDIVGIEAGQDTNVRTWHALAKALSVEIEDIIPVDQ